MEVNFTPDVQAKLEQMARDSGRRREEVLEDAVIGLYDEMADTRAAIEWRYDDLETGRVGPIPGHEVFASLRANRAARRIRAQ